MRRRLITVMSSLVLLAGCSVVAKTTNQAPNPTMQPSIAQELASVAQIPVSAHQSNGGELGAGWVSIISGNEPLVDSKNNQYFWHRPSLLREGSQVTYLSAMVYENSGVSVWQVTANCQTGVYQYLSSTLYSSSGQVIKTLPASTEALAKPGQIDGIVLGNVCNANTNNQTTQADLTRIQLEQLARARQTNADTLNQAMQTARMFH